MLHTRFNAYEKFLLQRWKFRSVYKNTANELLLSTGDHEIRITKENFPDTGEKFSRVYILKFHLREVDWHSNISEHSFRFSIQAIS